MPTAVRSVRKSPGHAWRGGDAPGGARSGRFIGPQIEQVLRGEAATWHENQLIPIIRHGQLQDVYWTYSFGPIDELDAPNGVGGVLVICTETTQQVLTERRLKSERESFAQLFEQAPSFMAVLRGPEHRVELVNPGYMRLIGQRDIVGKTNRGCAAGGARAGLSRPCWMKCTEAARPIRPVAPGTARRSRPTAR